MHAMLPYGDKTAITPPVLNPTERNGPIRLRVLQYSVRSTTLTSSAHTSTHRISSLVVAAFVESSL